MIRIQTLKEPKKTSGTKVDAGESILFKKIVIKNTGDKPVYVDYYKRKPWNKKEGK